MNPKQREFAEALSLYAGNLLNGFGWNVWTALETGSATVNMRLNNVGNLVAKPVEIQEQDVISLEEKLKEAKETIKAQDKTIKSLKEQIDSFQAQVEGEVTVEAIPEEPKRSRRKRTT